MITKITDTYLRRYTDNGQVAVYVEWIDRNGKRGRTEGAFPPGTHMQALLNRAQREGVPHRFEKW